MENRGNVLRLAVVAMFAAIIAGALAPACASAQALSDDWRFRGSVYFWMPTFSGSANLPGGNTADFDIKFHTLLDTLKMGGMGNIEAQKGRWGAFGDFIYLDLGGASVTTRDNGIDGVPLPATLTVNKGLDFKGFITTFGGSYRLLAEPGSSFDVLAGARMLWLKLSLNYSFSEDFGPFVGPNRSGSRTTSGTTWDGIVGVKGRAAFGDDRKWFIPYYADVGTGQSQYTYQLSAGLGYTFSWGEVIAVWRYLDWKEPGDHVPKLTVNGPQLGVAWTW